MWAGSHTRPHVHPPSTEAAVLDQGRPAFAPSITRRLALSSNHAITCSFSPHHSLLLCCLKAHLTSPPSISYSGGFVPSFHRSIAIQVRWKIIEMPPVCQGSNNEGKWNRLKNSRKGHSAGLTLEISLLDALPLSPGAKGASTKLLCSFLLRSLPPPRFLSLSILLSVSLPPSLLSFSKASSIPGHGQPVLWSLDRGRGEGRGPQALP